MRVCDLCRKPDDIKTVELMEQSGDPGGSPLVAIGEAELCGECRTAVKADKLADRLKPRRTRKAE